MADAVRKDIVNLLIFIIIISSLTYLTYERNRIWMNDITLWEDAVRKSPDNARAHNNLGRAYGAKGRNAEAIEEFKKAIEILPVYALAYMNLAVSYSQIGSNADAEFYYKKAIEYYPGLPEIYYNYGFFLYSRQRYIEAYQALSRYLELSPAGPFVPFTNKLISEMQEKGYVR